MSTQKIHLNKNTSIDTAKLLQSRMVVLANSGAGKSYAIRKFAEEAAIHTQTIIIDPEGEFSSLREKFDFILAGKDKDVPAETRSAALLAVRLLELGKSAVIDLYELHPQERQRFVKLFFDAMINAPKDLYHPVFIILDEAHEYAPEGKPSEATYAVEAMASRGRKRGFCLIPASQRISKLSKNVSAECNNKLIGRASQDIDMKRAGDELGFTKDRLVELRQLQPGEFFAFGPAISDEVKKIKIDPVKTTHAKVGYHGAAKVPPPSTVIKKVLAEIKDLPAEAEQEAKTIAELKKETAELKRKIKDYAHGNSVLLETSVTPDKIKKAVDKAVQEVEKKWIKKYNDQGQQMTNEVNRLVKVIQKIGEIITPVIENGIAIYSPLLTYSEVTYNDIVPAAPAIAKSFLPPIENPGHVMGSDMNKGEREILTAIAQHDGATTEHIAVLTGYKNTSRREYLRKLISRGYVIKEGDVYIATQEGILSLGNFTPLPTGRALVQHYLDTLPEGEKRLFDAMLLQHPSPVDTAILQSETGYKATSTREYLRKLIARKIVVKEGNLYRFSENLYGTD